MNTLTIERLREALHYDPRTGVFTWRRSTGRARAGDRAGFVCDIHGYEFIGLGGIHHRAHRLAWMYMTGAMPENVIDHRDGDRANNRFENLRDVTQAVNAQNIRAPRSDNTTGHLGVTKVGRRFRATFTPPLGATTHIGYFDRPEEAHAAYVAAKRQFHEGNTL